MFYEIAYESRKWTQTYTDTTETFVYHICNEDLEMDNFYGEFHAPNDDIGLALFIYSIFPDTRTFITPSGSITLFLTQIEAFQTTDDGWSVTLTYGPPQIDQPKLIGNYVQFAFSTNGDTKKITRSHSVRNSAKRTDITTNIPETYGLIGASKDSVEGADLSDAGLSFSLTGYYESDIWNTSIILLFTTLTKTYNNALFYGFPAGEVLLDNIEAQGQAYKTVPVTFHFIHQPNANGILDLPFPPLIALGHDLIDYRYMPEVNSDALVQWPAFRYVHQVRHPGNFNLLGI